jgi:hypothetical protein
MTLALQQIPCPGQTGCERRRELLLPGDGGDIRGMVHVGVHHQIPRRSGQGKKNCTLPADGVQKI